VTGLVRRPAKNWGFMQDPDPLSVEVLALGAKAKEVFGGARAVMLRPSPDGKLLAVRCLVNKQGDVNERGQVDRDRLFVLDARGEVLADIDNFQECHQEGTWRETRRPHPTRLAGRNPI
jgi:hypothetical protein